MTRSKLQIKTRFALLGNQIADFLKTKGSLYILFLSLVIVFMPYVHVRYNNTDIEGILGFKWMSSFLFALALPSVLVSAGLIIRFMSTKIDGAYTIFFRLLSLITIASGGFFFAWTFYPMTGDFSSSTYYIVLSVFAIAFAYASRFIQRAFISSEEKLKTIIRLLLKSLYSDLEKQGLVNPEKMKDFKRYRLEVTNKVMEHEQK